MEICGVEGTLTPGFCVCSSPSLLLLFVYLWAQFHLLIVVIQARKGLIILGNLYLLIGSERVKFFCDYANIRKLPRLFISVSWIPHSRLAGYSSLLASWKTIMTTGWWKRNYSMHHVRERWRGTESHRRNGWRVFNGTRKCMSEQRRASSVLLWWWVRRSTLLAHASDNYDDSGEFFFVL